jgi:adenylate cyclase
VCTVLFADVRGFTGIAEQLPPEGVHRLLNAFLHVMVASIVDHGGFIDKFVGDKVMALFTGRDHQAAAVAAVTAGRAIQDGVALLNAERKSQRELTIQVGIGVNTGSVMVGNVGDAQRMDFTAVGDAVNVTDRIQGLAAGGELLVGAETAAQLGQSFTLVDLGTQAVKGRVAPVHVFRVEPGPGA